MRTYDLSNLIPTPGVADQNLTVSDTALQLAALNDNTKHVLVTVATQPIRVTFDDSAPTTTNGHYWAAGQERVLKREAAVAMKVIRATGSDGELHASEMTY